MKTMLTIVAGLLISTSAAAQRPADKPQACWVETSAATMDGAMGGAGLRDTKIWHSTISGVLVRDAKGDVLSTGAMDRKSIVDADASVDEQPLRLPASSSRTPTMITLAAQHN